MLLGHEIPVVRSREGSALIRGSRQQMTGTVSAAISDEKVLRPNPLASVTRNYIVVRTSDHRSTTIIPLSRVSGIRRIDKRYPALLVISIAVLVVAAAAFSSKEGAGAPLPIALIGLFLFWLYFQLRKATVTLFLDSGAAETITGSLAEGKALVALIEFAQQSRWSMEDISDQDIAELN
jgi:hypothetical protein